MKRYTVTPAKVKHNAPLIALMEQHMAATRSKPIDLARELGVAHSTVLRWFSNESKVGHRNAHQIRTLWGGARAAPGGESLAVITSRLHRIWPVLTPSQMNVCESLVDSFYDTHQKGG